MTEEINHKGQVVAEALKTYLTDLNHNQLEFLGIDSEQRDIYCATNIIVWDRDDFSYLKGFSEKDHCLISAPLWPNKADDMMFTKIMLHEIGHRFFHQQRMEKSSFSTGVRYAAKALGYGFLGTTVVKLLTTGKKLFDYACNRDDISRREFLTQGSLLLIFGATASALNYPSRKEEDNSDDFADKVMPQQVIDLDYPAFDKSLIKNALDWTNNYVPLMKYTSTHPSDMDRLENSKIRCVEYTETARQLNMPDFRTYLKFEPT
jgi:hypothetical protein